MDMHDLKQFKQNMQRDLELIGSTKKAALADEAPARKNARRSLVADSPIKEGEVITRAHLTWKRPAFGISPEFIEDVIGKTATQDIAQDDILFWNMIK
jgi:N-acetylneuraminate synthase